MGEWVRGDDGVIRHCTDLLRELELSVHGFCLPDGRIVESVAIGRVARHARDYNDRSIGLEFVVEGLHDEDSLTRAMANVDASPYRPVQYEAAARWFRCHADALALDASCFRTHGELDPQRKTDPGAAFDHDAFLRAFESAAQPVQSR